MELTTLLERMKMEHLLAQLDGVCEHAAKGDLDYKGFLTQALEAETKQAKIVREVFMPDASIKERANPVSRRIRSFRAGQCHVVPWPDGDAGVRSAGYPRRRGRRRRATAVRRRVSDAGPDRVRRRRP